MYKLIILIALAITGSYAQDAAQGEAAPEPYSYGYETDSHSAAEQRDPSGKVSGYYTLADADGRERRVEYYADETGYHAKVQTNEVGTKSANSADVEVLASPPTREQLVYQQGPQVQQVQQQRVVSQQVAAGQPARSQTLSYVQQPYNTYQGAYYPGYGASSSAQYGYSAYPGYGYYNNGGYGNYNNGAYGNYNSNGAYGSYNNHLPSQYYRSISAGNVVQPATYGATRGLVSSTVSRSSPGVVSTVSGQNAGVGYATYPYNNGYSSVNYRGYNSYAGAPGQVAYQTSSVGPSVGYSGVDVQGANTVGAYPGSSNYIVLQKRDAENSEKKKSA